MASSVDTELKKNKYINDPDTYIKRIVTSNDLDRFLRRRVCSLIFIFIIN